jgi:phosphoglycerate dehydrogenase-like enzyme
MSEQPVVVVLLAERDPEPPALDTIRDRARVTVARSAEELEDAIADADVLFAWDFRTTLLPDAWPNARRMRWIHAASAGVDAVLIPEVVQSDIVVTNSRGVFDRGIAEFCLGAMLFFAKDARTTIELQRERRWRHRETELLRGARLLVVGAGSIGHEVGSLAKAVGLEGEGVARSDRDDPVFGRIAAQSELHTLLARADYVAITAPLTPDTEGLFDRDAFAAMKRGARLINVGRGPIVDEDALLDALRSGQVGGAALDVFHTEPLPEDHPFWEMPNVLVSHHMSGDYIGWREALVELFADNLSRYTAGEPLHNVVDKRRA